MTTVTQTGYLTDERRMLQEAARDFAMKEVLPLANKLDPEREDMPRSLIDKMAELGYFGITIPEKYGGSGLGCFEYCLIAEELSRAWMSVGSVIARGNTFMGSQMFNDAQRAAIMPRVARGEYLGALALSEPAAGSDLASVSCRARRDGDEWVITGNKYWCTFADAADFIFLLARSQPEVDPKRKHVGISAFIIDKQRGSFPPGIAGSSIPKIGYYGWKTGSLLLMVFAFQPVRSSARRDRLSQPSLAAWKPTEHTRPRVLSVLHAAHWRMQPNTHWSGCNSTSPLQIFKLSVLSLHKWQPKLKPLANSTTMFARKSTRANAAIQRLQ